MFKRLFSICHPFFSYENKKTFNKSHSFHKFIYFQMKIFHFVKNLKYTRMTHFEMLNLKKNPPNQFHWIGHLLFHISIICICYYYGQLLLVIKCHNSPLEPCFNFLRFVTIANKTTNCNFEMFFFVFTWLVIWDLIKLKDLGVATCVHQYDCKKLKIKMKIIICTLI